MYILGGTYLERIEEPRSEKVFGSGLRASVALSGSGSHKLFSIVDAKLKPYAEATAAPFRLDVSFSDRPVPISFSYHSPLSIPAIDGNDQRVDPLTINAGNESVLAFGMLEAEASIDAGGIVFDPQRPRGPRTVDRSMLRAGRFALVANATEIMSLGRSYDLDEAAIRLLSDLSADVVVVKRGALGAKVFEAGGTIDSVGPFRTDLVSPIGSGDVFSSTFAWAWLEDGRSPTAAAQLASAAAAAWCSGQRFSLGLNSSTTPDRLVNGVELIPRRDPVRVYLAGPFFDAGSRWLVGLTRQALNNLGARTFSPFHDVGMGGDEVAESDIKGLEASETIFALLDGADAGTLFELGYAAAKGVPMIGYAQHPELEDFKMLRGLGAYITNDLPTAVYRSIWAGMASK